MLLTFSGVVRRGTVTGFFATFTLREGDWSIVEVGTIVYIRPRI